MKNIKIGLIGFGVVGEGIYQVLKDRPHLNTEIKKIIIKDPKKQRNAPAELFSTNYSDILNDEEVQLIIELINDDKAAYEFTLKAFKKGKSVISANKKMIAEHHIELIELSQKYNVSFLYEAAVCGSVPIIRNLEEYFDNDLLTSIKGIVNGSTNYILSKMSLDKIDFETVLKDAQEKGFAESNPILDIEGFDAANKISIISTHAFGKQVLTEDVIRKGITALHPYDIQYAQEKNLVIKLVAKTINSESGELSGLSVYPTFINKEDNLGTTNNEYNGVVVKSTLADEQFFYGKGAGRFPTSSAVLSDISAYYYNYKYAYKKGISVIKPDNLGIGKFYLSFHNSTTIETNVFDKIEERFESNDRNYLIGTMTYQKLINSNFLKSKDISLISFN